MFRSRGAMPMKMQLSKMIFERAATNKKLVSPDRIQQSRFDLSKSANRVSI
jgi:hypothetical protein